MVMDALPVGPSGTRGPCIVPSRNRTEPVGIWVPDTAVTVIVIVTLWPVTAGFADDVTVVAVATEGGVSSAKSTLTFALPLRRITIVTSAVAPLVTCTVTGSLVQFGSAPAATDAQAAAKARPVNTTLPVGIPPIASTELAPAVTSKFCTTVRVAPAAERLTQATSAGTVVIVTRIVPTSSGALGV